jgi:type II secretory pathway component PulC
MITYLFGFVSGLVVVIVFYPMLRSNGLKSETISGNKLQDISKYEPAELEEINSEIKKPLNSIPQKIINLEISREAILENTMEPMALIIAARPMPYTNPKTGKLGGIIITEIDDSLPAHTLSGLQQNDVILSINKNKLSSIEQALELGREMKQDYETIEKVDVEILRDGRLITLKYKIF